ncbi:Uncharacterised protein [Candidatus Venteria ishoeyi]|uniref:Uncharacterized protein n=1 Tax=Candidatus Venteria ishoeyi TaxID=1899563 RepID=A0A1H6F8P2_9GAMM|nr:Uncharacterised protein [Candidatus Venteria ishoeyi]
MYSIYEEMWNYYDYVISNLNHIFPIYYNYYNYYDYYDYYDFYTFILSYLITMSIQNINVEDAIKRVKKLME